jgi:undecaprenyl-diphosphatase
MDYLYAIIFGVVQGVTEFLPISSSGHLVILHEILPFEITNEMAFDVALHFASLLAVLFFFRRDVWRLLLGWLASLAGNHTQESRIAWLLLLGTIPAALAGFFLGDLIEFSLRNYKVVAFMLVVVAAFFVLMEAVGRKQKKYGELGWKAVLGIGLAQAIALVPGTSRSGITIIAGLGAGLKREQAVRFSFLLSIPIISGAIMTQIPGLHGLVGGGDMPYLIAAFLSAFLSAFLAIKYFLQYARSHSLYIFAYYRVLLALAVVLFFLYA